jgi:hypothetical protein
MTLLGENTEWDSAKKVLNKRGFIKRLTKYDRKNVAKEVLQKVSEYTS